MMAVDMRLTAAVLLLCAAAPVVYAARCSFMSEIPRPERPELPNVDSTGLQWADRPLLPLDDERDEVCVEDFPTPDGARDQIINMDEEIEGDVYIARLNYDGTEQANVEVTFGSLAMLGPEIRFENGTWFLVITERQDFERPGMQHYLLIIRILDETEVAYVPLNIINIDDNAPFIIPRNETCELEELGEPGLTECEYEVTDLDGRISTSQMTFRIDSNRLDDQIFFVQGQLIPGVWDSMYMIIGVNQSLNFVTSPLHVFNITALDSLPNTNTMNTLIQVINVESRPPRWTEIFAVQQFNEKTNQTFSVQAIDGDTGIDKNISYTLRADPEDSEYFSIETIDGGRSGAIFNVYEIDRDALEREVFQVTLIAYKYDNRSFYEETNVVIIINDVNDQWPRPLHKEYFIEIMEETPQTLAFSLPFGFHDRDLGEHAQYNVTLEDIYPEHAASAFYIAPEVGYQHQTFIMGTRNHSMLDYENTPFQNISIRVVAVDRNNSDFVCSATVYINLINWNDEEPIFEFDTQTVTFNETEGEDFYVATALAKDRDIDDKVVHSLLGNAANFLRIDPDSGEIYVSANDSFDYHRQNEMFVQILATDTLGEPPHHTATSQLVIQLLDINNTPPTLRLARGSPNVEENVPEGYVIRWDISATDLDTTAELRFEIDWDTSYATKQGRETNTTEYHGCVEIETLYPQENNRGVAEGRLVVKEIRDNVTIDFEEFEVLYLTIRVIDLQTVIGENSDESTFTITIVDMNDNAPVWVTNTLEQEFRVTEMAASGTVIGSVQATDIDGPLYNQVRYTIQPRDGTPENLVEIDFVTGQITVKTSDAIDADEPPTYFLYYTVVANDSCYAEPCPDDPTFWDPEAEIAIRIMDTNNKWPRAIYDEEEATSVYDYVVRILENATQNDCVVQLQSEDRDRDEIYHNVSYQINYGVAPRLRAFFSVELATGLVYVDYTTDEVLDRDGDEPQHEIFLTLTDNFFTGGDGRRNHNETNVLVILLDVNDNAPEMPHPSTVPWSASENLLQGSPIDPTIHAHDRDQPDHDNSRVSYEILNLAVTNRDDLDEDLIQDLFYMETFCQTQFNCSGRLWTDADLRGFWGTYDLLLQAYDHGDPQQFSNETYQLEIRPYNFHSPVFVFPLDGSVIRLAKEWAIVNGVLTTVGGNQLERIVATDEDGLHAGVVTFTVSDNDEAVEYLEVLNEGENSGTLRLIQAINVEQQEPREFLVTITATDGGTEPNSLSTSCSIRLIFVPTQGEPIFNVDTASVAFFEGEQGLEERFELPAAVDPKNYGCNYDGNCHDIYYRIAYGNEEDYFALDSSNNILYLTRELDRNLTGTYELVVAASNSLTGPVLTSSSLTVTVTVREANPRPYFLRDIYTAGISTIDLIGKELLTVQAVHSDGDAVTYSINQTSMVVDSSLEAVRESAFTLHEDSGLLTLAMQPTASMHGMFEFDVVATDTVGATDTAEVKVYLISTLNRVIFTFVNTPESVEAHRDFIAQTFSAGFNMTCNIDQVLQGSDNNGVAQEMLTEVRAHFIRDHVPVSAEEIEQLRSDTVLLRTIQQTLNTELLVLLDFVTEHSPEPTDPNLVTVYVLAGLSALLAFMCLVLLLTFFIRTRALNRRLQALSMTKYGSEDSGLNRVGIAPGTNRFAAEGANPIWNEAIKAPDFDAISDTSNDSDLIGVEDLAQFNDDYFPPGDTNSVDDIVPARDTVANHNNQFLFNTSPFSAGFTNSNFRK